LATRRRYAAIPGLKSGACAAPRFLVSVWPHATGITPSWAQTTTAVVLPADTMSATWEGVTILSAGKAAA
jgi:hypothetical protein